MKHWIYERGTVIGTFDYEPKGLYYRIACEIRENATALRRLYAVSGVNSYYIGIPDPQGKLERQLKRKLLPDGISSVVSSEGERGEWSPWRGEADGVAVEDALIRQEAGQLFLALSPAEALKFPAWADQFTQENIEQKPRMLVQLTPDGKLPAAQTDNGRYIDETETDDIDLTDPQLPADTFPFDGGGFTPGYEDDGGQANCSDL